MKITTVDLGGICVAKVVDSRTGEFDRARIRDNAPHSHYALDREDIHIELAAFEKVCRRIGERSDWTVFEPFGGSGWHSSLIRRLVGPRKQFVVDISKDCIRSVCAGLKGNRGVIAICGDGCDYLRHSKWKFNWIHADFNIWTAEDMSLDPELRGTWNALFEMATDCITFTDTTHYHLANSPVVYWYDEVDRWIKVTKGWKVDFVFDWGPAAMHVLSPLKEKEKEVFAKPLIVQVREPMKVTVLREESSDE